MTLTATLLTQLLGTQGSQGLNTRSGSGAPSSSTPAVDGEPYVDTTNVVAYPARQNGTWASGQSLLGVQGNRGVAGGGPAIPGAYNTVIVNTGFSSQTGLSSSWQTLTVPGQTSSYHPFYPQTPGFFGGANFQWTLGGGSSLQFRCIDENTGNILYTSPTYTASGTDVAVVNPVAYSIVAGSKLSWQVAGSGSMLGLVSARYIIGSCVTPGVRSLTPCAYSATSTGPMTICGTATPFYFTPTTTAVLYDVTIQNKGTGTIAVALFGSSTVWSSGNIAGGTEFNTGNYDYTGSNQIMLGGGSYFWAVTGNVTGAIYLQAQAYI